MTDQENSLDALVKEAMFKSLDQAKRDELVKKALASLLLGREAEYGYGTTSDLQQAFSLAVREQARIAVKEHIEGDEKIKAAIKTLIHDALDKALMGDLRSKLVTKVAEAVVTVLSGDV